MMFSMRSFNISTRYIIARSNLVKCYSTKKPEIPKNMLADVYTASQQSGFGTIYDKKPFKITLEEGKIYAWCTCGHSHTQPFCDGTHQSIYLKLKHKPVKFKVSASKDYWLCNCKQTKNRPFCDGTHKDKDVQDAHSTI